MSMFKEFAMPPLVLTVIAAVVTGALVATESVTTPIIEQQAAAAADAARAVVLPSADSFTQVTVDEMPEGGVDIYEANNGTGYVVTAQAKGYGGMLKVMVGIDSNGLISGTEVLENNETQGLGSKVSEHAFMDQYIGKDSTLEGIETISGTTISSNAFSKAVQNAYQVYGVAAVSYTHLEELGNDVIAFPEPWMASESFSQLQKLWPGVFALLGINNPEKGTGAAHHNEYFDLDEDVFKLGVAGAVTYALRFLDSDVDTSSRQWKGSVRDLFTELGIKPEVIDSYYKAIHE